MDFPDCPPHDLPSLEALELGFRGVKFNPGSLGKSG